MQFGAEFRLCSPTMRQAPRTTDPFLFINCVVPGQRVHQCRLYSSASIGVGPGFINPMRADIGKGGSYIEMYTGDLSSSWRLCEV